MSVYPYSGFASMVMEEVVLEDDKGIPTFSCTMTFPAPSKQRFVNRPFSWLSEFGIESHKARKLLAIQTDDEAFADLPVGGTRPNGTLKTWFWLMKLSHPYATMMAAKKTAFVCATWSEAELVEIGGHLGLSAHDVLTFMQIKPKNRAERRARGNRDKSRRIASY